MNPSSSSPGSSRNSRTSRTSSGQTLRIPRPHLAVVLGGGLAGMLTAAALSEKAEVIVVERDRLPATAAPRKGLPQAQHAHFLWSGGARAIERLVPGTARELLTNGAHRIALPTGLVSLAAQGWIRRWPETQFLVACSRDLLDQVVRRRVLAQPGITVLQRSAVEGLAGTSKHVTGVFVRDLTTGAVSRLDADLVVDTTGQASEAPRWLTDLGLPAVREEVMDSGRAYASRIYRAPVGTENYPVVQVHADPSRPVPGQTATLVPIEGQRWLVTVSGTRGGQPMKDGDRFVSFARQVRHPVVGDLIAAAEPLSDVRLTRGIVERRRHFEQLKSWPTGFVVLGDAVATYNPVYAQGMSVAAHSVAALRGAVRSRGLDDPGLARALQRSIGRMVQVPWELTTGQDVHYPGAAGPRPTAATQLLQGYFDRVVTTAAGRPSTARALFEVLTLSAPVSRLLRPSVALGALLGPGRTPLINPPLTTSERSSSPLRPTPVPSSSAASTHQI